ncbi:sigma-70 family RNA polymerase sigma factor [Amycolatopsis sp. NPDC059021]|uniref:sigma-70 family RNA polymerase sigma factor n=1 Tax=Amycolatopsis sp. NPDC059021 TaxID=3346704 RepID=UPI0036708E36
MTDHDRLTLRFEEHRPQLKAVAYRMLGSVAEAEDAVQEAWLKLDRADTTEVANLGGWLTTVIGRICLNMLQARKSRREEPSGVRPDEAVAGPADGDDPEQEAVLADSVGLALLVVLDTLAPPERLAFVLHDLFGVPFDEIAAMVDRSPAAARQLASRARRRVRGADSAVPDPARQREIVDAFLAASRGGDFQTLLSLLAPDAVLHADAAAVKMGVPRETGAAAVAKTFAGRAHAAKLAIVDGVAGAVWSAGGRARVLFAFTIEDDRIVAIDMLADPERLGEIDLVIAGSRPRR